MKKTGNSVHKFEDDLALITKLKEDSDPMLKQFFKDYTSFEKVSKMRGKAFTDPDKIIGFILKSSDKIEEMFSIIDAAMPFSYKNLNYTIVDFCNKTGADVKRFSYVKDSKDIIDLFKSIVISTNYLVLQNKQYPKKIELYTYIMCATIKMYLDNYAKKLKNMSSYLNESYVPFKKYCNLIIKREEISDSLMQTIIGFIADDRYNLKDKTITKEDYIEEFKEYTKKFNLMVKENRKRVIVTKNKNEPNKNVPSIKPVSYVTEEIINEKNKIEKEKNKKEQDEINKWVSAFLPSLCDLNETVDIKNILPQPYLKNYNKIMLLLLSKFEEYCINKGYTTMIDQHVYMQLEDIVESLKK